MKNLKLEIFRTLLIACLGVFAVDVQLVTAADDAAVPRTVVKKKAEAKKTDAKAAAEEAKADAKKTVEKKPAAKKAGGGVMKALFKAFVPAVNVRPPQFAQPQLAQPKSIPALSETATKEEIEELEKKILKKPNGKTYINRFKPQFETMCRGELRFVHDVCNCTRAQFLLIQDDAKLTTQRALLGIVNYQMSIEQGWNGKPPKQPEAETTLEIGMLQSVETHLSAVQTAAYRTEIEARQSFRKLADAEIIVAALDKDLHLTAEQRAEIVSPIQDAWKASWKQNIQLLENNGNRYMPVLPKTEIKKFLTSKQKSAFLSVGQYGSSFFGMQVDLPQGNQNDKGDLLEELDFAPEEESP